MLNEKDPMDEQLKKGAEQAEELTDEKLAEAAGGRVIMKTDKLTADKLTADKLSAGLFPKISL